MQISAASVFSTFFVLFSRFRQINRDATNVAGSDGKTSPFIRLRRGEKIIF